MDTKENARWQAGAETTSCSNSSSTRAQSGATGACSPTNAEFMAAMFSTLPVGAAAMTCAFPGDPASAARGAWFARPWMPGDAARETPRWNAYVAVSSFLPDPTTGEFRRRKASFARLHALMLDDLGTKLPLSHAARVKPSALIETSPGNFQCWLFLRPCEVTDDREQAARLIEAMIREGLAAASDPGMSGVTRYGRLPVGINGKARYRCPSGAPFPVSVAEWSPETRYNVASVVQAFGLDVSPPRLPERPRRLPVPVGAAHRRIDDFASLLRAVRDLGLYQGALGEGRHGITCPWAGEHTGCDLTGCAIFEPNARNRWSGGFRCHHSHGDRLHIGHVYEFVRNLSRGAA